MGTFLILLSIFIVLIILIIVTNKFRPTFTVVAVSILCGYSVWFFQKCADLKAEADFAQRNIAEFSRQNDDAIKMAVRYQNMTAPEQFLGAQYVRIDYNHSADMDRYYDDVVAVCSGLCAELLVDNKVQEVTVGPYKSQHITFRLGSRTECTATDTQFFPYESPRGISGFSQKENLAPLLGLCAIKVSQPKPVQVIISLSEIRGSLSEVRTSGYSIDIYQTAENGNHRLSSAAKYELRLIPIPPRRELKCIRPVEFSCQERGLVLVRKTVSIGRQSPPAVSIIGNTLGFTLDGVIGNTWVNQQQVLANIPFGRASLIKNPRWAFPALTYLIRQGIPLSNEYVEPLKKLSEGEHDALFYSLISLPKADPAGAFAFFAKNQQLIFSRINGFIDELRADNYHRSSYNYIRAIEYNCEFLQNLKMTQPKGMQVFEKEVEALLFSSLITVQGSVLIGRSSCAQPESPPAP